ncbi:SLIT-ROBO Rho GTPase-activating protein 1b [Tachysurus ichikawai]
MNNPVNFTTCHLLHVSCPVQVKKTSEATLSTIQDMLNMEDYDVSESFQHSRSTESVKSSVSDTYLSKPSLAKRRANQQETELFYFTKLREYLEGSNLISKLQAKHDLLKRSIAEGEFISSSTINSPTSFVHIHTCISEAFSAFVSKDF